MTDDERWPSNKLNSTFVWVSVDFKSQIIFHQLATVFFGKSGQSSTMIGIHRQRRKW